MTEMGASPPWGERPTGSTVAGRAARPRGGGAGYGRGPQAESASQAGDQAGVKHQAGRFPANGRLPGPCIASASQ